MGAALLSLGAFQTCSAIAWGGWWSVLAWGGAAFSIAGAAHVAGAPWVLGKGPDGRMGAASVLALLPYFLFTWGRWQLEWLLDTGEPVGRSWSRTLSRPVAGLVASPPGVGLVVDMTAELPAPSWLVGVCQLRDAANPRHDGTGPSSLCRGGPPRGRITRSGLPPLRPGPRPLGDAGRCSPHEERGGRNGSGGAAPTAGHPPQGSSRGEPAASARGLRAGGAKREGRRAVSVPESSRAAGLETFWPGSARMRLSRAGLGWRAWLDGLTPSRRWGPLAVVALYWAGLLHLGGLRGDHVGVGLLFLWPDLRGRRARSPRCDYSSR